MLGRPLLRFDTVSSTMTVLGDLAAIGAEEGTTVVTGYQSAGRGRADRQWHTPPNTALLASVLLRPHLSIRHLMPLSILVADAIATVAQEGYGLDTSIKWPNDVLVDGRKLSGVLIQTRSQVGDPAVIVGIGINANTLPEDLPATATSVLAECGAAVDRDILLLHMLEALSLRYRELLVGNLEHRWQDIQHRIAMRGEVVSVQEGDSVVTGVLQRIDRDGALVLTQNSGERRVVVGDLVRGPKVHTGVDSS